MNSNLDHLSSGRVSMPTKIAIIKRLPLALPLPRAASDRGDADMNPALYQYRPSVDLAELTDVNKQPLPAAECGDNMREIASEHLKETSNE